MWTPDPRKWFQDSTSVNSGFKKVCFPRFLIFRHGICIPQSNIFWTPDSTSKYFLDSGFHKQIFSGFRITQANIFWIPILQAHIFWTPDYMSKCFLDSGFHKQIFSWFWIPRANVPWILYNPDYFTQGDVVVSKRHWIPVSFLTLQY